jgi:hypothetical protein
MAVHGQEENAETCENLFGGVPGSLYITWTAGPDEEFLTAGAFRFHD